MVTVELIFNTGPETFQIPSCWEDVTLKKYIELQALENRTIGNISKLYCGIENEKVAALLGFMANHIEPTLPEGFKINIGKQTWEKLEWAKKEISSLDEEKPDFITLYCRLIEIYTTFAVDQLNCVEGIGLGKHLYDSVLTFLNQFKELQRQEGEEDPAAELAGTEELDALGYLVTLDELAKGQVWMHDTILKMSAQQIYFQLITDKRKARFQKNYSQAYKQLNDIPGNS